MEREMKSGKVWLVGAGPAETDLLTVKAKKIIRQAEVVIYDRLVGQGILALIPAGVECIDVGKRAGNHTLPQEEINRLLVREASRGKRVVRLKGGDPFLFGRGGEELELLRENQIPYEVIPGITSAIAVPAYQGIPVTHRDYCSSVHIITGHRGKDKPYDIDFEALVRTKGTLIFLMGAAALGDICKGLIEAGIEKDMPAAVLQQGTTARQKRLVATVCTLEQAAKEQGVKTPAIIVVGKVCQLADEFSWYERLPLAGCRILLTRPRERISVLSEKLKDRGAEVLELPTIAIAPIAENEALKAALHRLNTYQWLVFTSPSGAEIFFDALRAERLDIRRLGAIKVAAVGEGTKRKVEERGILVDLLPDCFDGKSLGEAVGRDCKDGDKILLPRARAGNPEILAAITENRSVVIVDIPIYDTVFSQQNLFSLREEFEQGKIDFVMFTSASTVKGFVAAAEGLDYRMVHAVCIGEQTEAEAKKYQMETRRAKKADLDSLIEAAEELAVEIRGECEKTR